ncbi:MAG: GDP-L-fucose synthase [Pseudomonadota bacterium]
MQAAEAIYDLAGKRVFVAGHRGMVGSAILRRLAPENCGQTLTVAKADLDLRDQAAVNRWMSDNRPDTVFIPAAKVGGIHANAAYPAEFLYDNVVIAANLIHAAHQTGVQKLLFLGSSCIYPRLAPQPLVEEALLTGPLEPTNEWYAIAKIAGVKLCEAYRRQYGDDFISAMPTNLYGPDDNYHPENSHVIPGMIRRAHEAKLAGERDFTIWGTGKPYREFMYVDDCADALIFLMKHYSSASVINVAVGSDISIADLARMVMEIVGLKGDLKHDLSKPDGTPRKLMSPARLLQMGWSAKTPLRDGLKLAYESFKRGPAGAA